MTNGSSRSAAIAAAVIMGGFMLLFFVMPSIMIWLGNISPWIAGLFGLAAVLSFFLVFWLRARHQRRKG
ncbi:intracellular growth attenuator family protein [Allorhizobium pseudoryzae]|jgi:hypothetical protein|uniref:intracellular growth attenuator family protein n=1 Tax=Allorhizobium pseudoryzae TaxID=379684 RepID=UPI0013E9E38F|nr:intracellular growth attenuator family protein [Allorhizobium pseudoryzae]